MSPEPVTTTAVRMTVGAFAALAARGGGRIAVHERAPAPLRIGAMPFRRRRLLVGLRSARDLALATVAVAAVAVLAADGWLLFGGALP